MKKAFTLVVLIVAPTMAFAQGTVGFANNSSELVRQWTSASDPTLITVPVGGAQLELFAAPNGTAFTPFLSSSGIPDFTTLAGFLAANPGWAIVNTSAGLTTTGIGPVPGRFNGGNVALPNVAGGATAEYVFIGWTGSASSIDVAVAGGALMFGSSPMLTTLTGNPQGTPPVPAVLLSATLTWFPLQPIPEPTTLALVGLGAAALMIFRRRR